MFRMALVDNKTRYIVDKIDAEMRDWFKSVEVEYTRTFKDYCIENGFYDYQMEIALSTACHECTLLAYDMNFPCDKIPEGKQWADEETGEPDPQMWLYLKMNKVLQKHKAQGIILY